MTRINIFVESAVVFLKYGSIHDNYDGNAVILSKRLFKCEVNREAGKAVSTQNLCHNFFRIKLLLMFPETL